MRALVLLAMVAVVAFAVVGCGDDPNAPDANSNEPQKIRSDEDIAAEQKNFNEPPPVQILTGDKTGVRGGKPVVIVAKSRSEFNDMLARHFSKGTKKEFIAETDFKTRQIVGVFAPTQRSGSVLSVTDVYPNEGKDSFTVEAVLLVPPKNCKLRKGSPRPFNIVESSRMAGEPVLKVNTQENSGC